MSNATLIYNPLAGPSNLAATLALVADAWRAKGWQVMVRPTEAVGHATVLAQQAAAAGQRLVLAAGGDGTLGEVANGLAGTPVIMAPLPAGTSNSFAQELGLPLPGRFARNRLLRASDALAAGTVHDMDMGYLDGDGHGDRADGGRHWLLWAGVGVDSFLVHQMEPRPKWIKAAGRASYILQGLVQAPRLPNMVASVDIDGQIYEDEYVLVLISNVRRYAGGLIELNPEARLDDGRFEVWLLEGSGVPRTLQHLANALLNRLGNLTGVHRLEAQRVSIETRPTMPLQVDGERAGSAPVVCHIVPGALRLLVPATAPPDLFRRAGEPISAR